MAKYTLEENTTPEFALLPVDSIVTVQVTEITDRNVPGKDGRDDWTKLEFAFEITGIPSALEAQYGSVVGSRIWGSVGARFTEHPDNKLRQWSEALLNLGDLSVGFELDTDMLVGRKARAVISQYKKRDGSFQHQVSSLLPMVMATTVAAPAAATAAFDVFAGATDEPPF